MERQAVRGRVVVGAAGGKLDVVNELKLEQYIKGVVGLEMPDRWPAPALEAQAVAARTYALARMASVAKESTYDMYSDTRSQVYGGIEAETPSVDAAVDATARRVLLYRGNVITAYYSSSSGGRTVSAAEAFGTPVPYLVSVDDPYDTVSPNHDWGPMLFDARKVAKALKVKGDLLDLRATDGPSGHVVTVIATGPTRAVNATGTDMRTLLGLRSTMFSLGWLALDPPTAEAGYGVLTQLTGIARDTGPVVLQARKPDGSWETVAPVKPDKSGRLRSRSAPEATTRVPARGRRGRRGARQPHRRAGRRRVGEVGRRQRRVKPALPGVRCSYSASGARPGRRWPRPRPTAAARSPSALRSRPARTACAGRRAAASWPASRSSWRCREARAACRRRARRALGAGRLARGALGRRRTARAAECRGCAASRCTRARPGRTLVVNSAHRPQVRGRVRDVLDGVKRRVASVRKTGFENTEPLAASAVVPRTGPRLGLLARRARPAPASPSRSSTRASTTGTRTSRAA